MFIGSTPALLVAPSNQFDAPAVDPCWRADLDLDEAATREAIALVLDVADDAFDVDVAPELSRMEVVEPSRLSS